MGIIREGKRGEEREEGRGGEKMYSTIKTIKKFSDSFLYFVILLNDTRFFGARETAQWLRELLL